MHAEVLVSAVAKHADDPWELALAFDEATERDVRPWHDATTSIDRRRVREMQTHVDGVPFELDDAGRIGAVLNAASSSDPTCTRLAAEMTACLALPDDVFARPGVLDHVLGLADQVTIEDLPGPDRGQLLELVA